MTKTIQVEHGARHIFELRSGGEIWACEKGSTSNVTIDRNPQTQCIAADPDTTNVFLMHQVGTVWQFNWESRAWYPIDESHGSRQITAAGGKVYSTHGSSIWRYDPAARNWQPIDNQPATKGILAIGDRLFQIHASGQIWKFSPEVGNWQCVEGNSHGNTITISRADNHLFQLHKNGTIWCFNEPDGAWFPVDSSPNAIWISSGGNQLHQLHKDGRVWRLEGREWNPSHQISETEPEAGWLENLINTGQEITETKCRPQLSDFSHASIAAGLNCLVPQLAPFCIPSRVYQAWTAWNAYTCVREAVANAEKPVFDSEPGWKGADRVAFDTNAAKSNLERIERHRRELEL